MDTDRLMSVVTCATSVLTTVFVALACLPHMKQGLVIIRDLTLWCAFLAVLATLGWLGWTQYAPPEWRVPAPAATRTGQVPAVSTPAPISATASHGDPYFVRIVRE